MKKEYVLTSLPSNKIRYHHILKDIQILMDFDKNYNSSNLKKIQSQLSQHYCLKIEELNKQGFMKAYRQIVEGL